MPRASKLYQPLLAGYVTEVTPLTYPEGSSKDELNSVITSKKARSPRLGFREEDAAVYSTVGAFNITSNHYWENPGNQKKTRFLVVQTDNILHFWDISTFNMSNRKKSFTVNLNDYLNPFSTTAANDLVDASSGKGFLFVSSPAIESFYIEYLPDTDTIEVTTLTLKIRDFKFLPTVEDFTSEPLAPSLEFQYNLANQGWSDKYIDQYINGTDVGGFRGFGRYPSLTKHWALGKRPYISSQSTPNVDERRKIGLNLFDPRELEAAYTGTTVAPNGHFIYDAFRINRTVNGIPVRQEIINRRPISNCFKFGRAWWTDGNLIFFSQIIEQDINKSQNCYQDADPTSDEISDLIDTDGGTINIMEAGNIIKIIAASNSVIVFAENGVWDISGSEGEPFKPTAYIPRKIGDSEILNVKTIAVIEGIPMWAATDGLYTLSQDEITRSYIEQSLTDQTIKTYFDQIIDKEALDIDFDRASNKVFFQFNRDVLVYDLINGSWHPWRIATSSNSIIGVFSTRDRGTINDPKDVVADGEFVKASGAQVVVSLPVPSDSQITIKFIIRSGDTLTFGSFTDSDYYDWNNQEYSAYIETGYIYEEQPVTRKSVPHATFFFEEDSINSECILQHKWDFSNSEESKLWSDPIDIYQTAGTFKDVAKVTRMLNGAGIFVQFRFENVPGKGFTLHGYHIEWDFDAQRKDS